MGVIEQVSDIRGRTIADDIAILASDGGEKAEWVAYQLPCAALRNGRKAFFGCILGKGLFAI
jgi:hypothetical protein